MVKSVSIRVPKRFVIFVQFVFKKTIRTVKSVSISVPSVCQKIFVRVILLPVGQWVFDKSRVQNILILMVKICVHL